MRLSLRVFACLIVFALCCIDGAAAFERIAWQSRSLTAGNVDLVTRGYTLRFSPGTANFSPELSLPVEVIYSSVSDRSGVFGYRWYSPQLESRVIPGREGARWQTPWGETISFMRKGKPGDNLPVLFKEQMEGSGWFSPYADWAASGKDGDWDITGVDDYAGWRFVYRASRLYLISAPTGRRLEFRYSGEQLTSVVQNGAAFIRLSYKRGLVEKISINGVDTVFDYRQTNHLRLPEKTDQESLSEQFVSLRRIATGNLVPQEISYNEDGYLCGLVRGERSQTLVIERETIKERIDWLTRIEVAREEGKNTRNILPAKSTGRLLRDSDFSYAYTGSAGVEVTNAEKQTARYEYNDETGVLSLTSFAGLRQQIYYFRRYDVAYNGKLRQVTDARGRVVVDYRYDKSTGRVVRTRMMDGREMHYDYNKAGKIELVSRIEENPQNPKRPLVGIAYDKAGNPQRLSMLDSKGQAVLSTEIKYNRSRAPEEIRTAEGTTQISYNRFGLPEKITDIFGRVTRREYDRYNRLSATVDYLGLRTEVAYNANGQLEGISRSAPDREIGRPATLISAVMLEYDGYGQVRSLSDQGGKTKKFDRDIEGRIIREYFPDGTTCGYEYNSLGQLATVQDQNEHQIKFAYSRFGSLAARTTPAGQSNVYEFDQYGLITGVKSRWEDGKTDRAFAYKYDEYDRITRIDFGNGQSREISYDYLGRLATVRQSDRSETRVSEFAYDEFDRVARKSEIVTRESAVPEMTLREYAYTPSGKRRMARITFPDGAVSMEENTYDQHGRLAAKVRDGRALRYEYDRYSRVSRQTIDGHPVSYEYDERGQLAQKAAGFALDRASVHYQRVHEEQLRRNVLAMRSSGTGATGATGATGVAGANGANGATGATGNVAVEGKESGRATLKYFYSESGEMTGREINGRRQMFVTDARGQLVGVKDEKGEFVERYSFDPAGNLLEKTVFGKTTKFTYDAANQIKTRTEFSGQAGESGKVTEFAYDAAGRMTKEGEKSFEYGWLDKVLRVRESGKITASFGYGVDNQVAYVNRFGADGQPDHKRSESLFWDGLTLVRRNNTYLLNEPYPTGGNPVLAYESGAEKASADSVFFNDILGSTLGVINQSEFQTTDLTLFGEKPTTETAKPETDAFFTGKPEIEELGYAFLFRNYRPENTKWQTADPLGYPDGSNSFTYVSSKVSQSVDIFGLWEMRGKTSAYVSVSRTKTLSSDESLKYSFSFIPRQGYYSWGTEVVIDWQLSAMYDDYDIGDDEDKTLFTYSGTVTYSIDATGKISIFGIIQKSGSDSFDGGIGDYEGVGSAAYGANIEPNSGGSTSDVTATVGYSFGYVLNSQTGGGISVSILGTGGGISFSYGSSLSVEEETVNSFLLERRE